MELSWVIFRGYPNCFGGGGGGGTPGSHAEKYILIYKKDLEPGYRLTNETTSHILRVG